MRRRKKALNVAFAALDGGGGGVLVLMRIQLVEEYPQYFVYSHI